MVNIGERIFFVLALIWGLFLFVCGSRNIILSDILSCNVVLMHQLLRCTDTTVIPDTENAPVYAIFLYPFVIYFRNIINVVRNVFDVGHTFVHVCTFLFSYPLSITVLILRIYPLPLYCVPYLLLFSPSIVVSKQFIRW